MAETPNSNRTKQGHRRQEAHTRGAKRTAARTRGAKGKEPGVPRLDFRAGVVVLDLKTITMDAPSFSGGGTGGVGLMAAVPDARDEMLRLLPSLEFGRQLGRGAYGSVYKAKVRKEHASAADSGLRAVKVVEPNKQPRALRERFVRNVMDEIRLLNVAST